MKRVAGTCLAFWAVLAASQIALAQSAPPGDAARGRETFRQVGCWECHGTSGEGGGWQGPRIAPRPLPWAAFNEQLRRPRSQMPPYHEDVLSSAEAADIYAYLSAVPAARPAGEIPQLSH